MLKAKVDGKWFEVGAFYSDEHPHISKENDCVWLYSDGKTQSGFVDLKDVESFSYEPDKDI